MVELEVVSVVSNARRFRQVFDAADTCCIGTRHRPPGNLVQYYRWMFRDVLGNSDATLQWNLALTGAAGRMHRCGTGNSTCAVTYNAVVDLYLASGTASVVLSLLQQEVVGEDRWSM